MPHQNYVKQPQWKVVVVHCVAKALGILVHVEGFPIGSDRNLDTSLLDQGWIGVKQPKQGT